MTVTIHESTGTTAKPQGGRMLIQIITPGTGSSGVYPQQVLEAAAGARVFPAGTLMFADHPTATAEHDLPERSIRDVAGVLTEDAYWDGSALVAEARTYEPWASVIGQMHDAIGVSIRATARVEESDEQGRPIIAELVEGLSVDFVTYPGRGGAIRQVYESAPAPSLRVIAEALPGDLTADDLAARLEAALGPDEYVQDHTDEWVVYATWIDGQRVLVRRTYEATDDGQITLTGEPVPVARRVTYDALNPPSSPAGVAMESREEPTVAQIQIDEAEHKRLTTAAESVTALEAERDTLTRERDALTAQLAEARKATEAATIARIIGEADVQFTALERAGLTADLPRGEDDDLDVAAFEARVKTAAAESRAAMGDGRPHGVGVTESTTYTEADLHRDLGITTKES